MTFHTPVLNPRSRSPLIHTPSTAPLNRNHASTLGAGYRSHGRYEAQTHRWAADSRRVAGEGKAGQGKKGSLAKGEDKANRRDTRTLEKENPMGTRKERKKKTG